MARAVARRRWERAARRRWHGRLVDDGGAGGAGGSASGGGGAATAAVERRGRFGRGHRWRCGRQGRRRGRDGRTRRQRRHRQRRKRHRGSGTGGSGTGGTGGAVTFQKAAGHDSQFAAAELQDQPREGQLADGADLAVDAGRPPDQPAHRDQRLPRHRRQRGVLDLRRVEPGRAQAALQLHDAQPHRRRSREPHGLVRPLRRHLLHGHDRRQAGSTSGTSPARPRPSTSRRSRFPARATATTPKRSGASPGRGSTSTSAPPTTASRSSTRPIPPRRRS